MFRAYGTHGAEEECLQGLGGKTRRKQTILKTQAQILG
jgi:hypothetical protein